MYRNTLHFERRAAMHSPCHASVDACRGMQWWVHDVTCTGGSTPGHVLVSARGGIKWIARCGMHWWVHNACHILVGASRGMQWWVHDVACTGGCTPCHLLVVHAVVCSGGCTTWHAPVGAHRAMYWWVHAVTCASGCTSWHGPWQPCLAPSPHQCMPPKLTLPNDIYCITAAIL